VNPEEKLDIIKRYQQAGLMALAAGAPWL